VSKFGSLRDAKNRAALPEVRKSEPAPLPSPAPPRAFGPGSRGGKRDDPTYSQATTYLPSTLLHKVKGRLHEERGPGGKGRDLSDLVAELLTTWISECPTR
jgi:hypothetical protein